MEVKLRFQRFVADPLYSTNTKESFGRTDKIIFFVRKKNKALLDQNFIDALLHGAAFLSYVFSYLIPPQSTLVLLDFVLANLQIHLFLLRSLLAEVHKLSSPRQKNSL